MEADELYHRARLAALALRENGAESIDVRQERYTDDDGDPAVRTEIRMPPPILVMAMEALAREWSQAPAPTGELN